MSTFGLLHHPRSTRFMSLNSFSGALEFGQFDQSSQMLSLQSFLRKGVSLGYVGRIKT